MAVDLRGRGYYLHVKTRKEIEVQNHLYDVVQNPQKFGLSPRDIENLTRNASGEKEERRAVITEMLKRGWIRLRDHGGEWSIEYWGKDDVPFLKTIYEWGGNLFAPLAFLEINNVARRTGSALTWMEFEDAWEEGEYDELMPGSARQFKQQMSRQAKLHATPFSKLSPEEQRQKKAQARRSGFGSRAAQRRANAAGFGSATQMKQFIQTSEELEFPSALSIIVEAG